MSTLLDFDDRTETMSDAEFDRLPRYASGDIVDLYAVYPFFSDDQLAELTPDDAGRVEAFNDAALADLYDLEQQGVDFSDAEWAEAA